jgi:catechol 2,3-dioxygenase-like lactoylglutathione lyase family enzyme
MPKFAHINIVTGNWKRLADFYIDVFGCRLMEPERDLRGDWLDQATAIPNAHITGIHLALPGYDKNPPPLEIFQYNKNEENSLANINRTGFGHIAFEVDDVHQMLEKLLSFGGSQVGSIVEKEIPGAGTVTFVYARDIDGNIVELQSWKHSV